ncbi:MAG: glycoside hydrolase family 127 protein [Clostridia bacterium]|nr:glycoside hydrolase family 127 protein [Clostridia bacterium]
MKTYRRIPFTDVDIIGGFWRERQQLNREATIPAVMNRFMETGRFEAFKCGWREGSHNKPHIFWDSDVAKWIESVAYVVEKASMPEMERIVEQTIDEIELHQTPDGYVNSYFTSVEPGMRWRNRSWHELYCAGHLIEAAVAWRHATGRDRFLKIMRRYADYIDRVFRVERSAAFQTPGHEEIELALVKLYHATGEKKYLDLARFFIDRRGANPETDGQPLTERLATQSHMPVREMRTAEGHAVRAGYLFSAMADLAREDGDESLRAACEAVFDNIVNRRMYITGGVGSTLNSETYTIDYDLPNETAYAETCAAISLAYFAGRMLLIEPDAKYADAVERVLYNGFLSGLSLDGTRFFYTNPLEIVKSRRGAHPCTEKGDWLPIMERVEVFSCSCCPPNVTRFLASLGDFAFTEDDETVFVHQYMPCSAKAGEARLTMETDYPRGGVVRVKARGLNGRRLALRVPGWCSRFELSAPYALERGCAIIDAADAADVTLTLDMTPQLIEARSNVADCAGKAAMTRGPVVYCMEGVDNGGSLADIRLDPAGEVKETGDYGGLPVLEARGWRRPVPQGEWLYRPYTGRYEEKKLTFIPYFAFANRGESDMRVWIPVRMIW